MSQSNESKKYLKQSRHNINKSSNVSTNIQPITSPTRTFQSIGTNFPGRKLWERPMKAVVPSTHGLIQEDRGERLQKNTTKTEGELRRREQEIQYLKQKVKELETKCRHEENLRKVEQQRGIKQLESVTRKCEFLEGKIYEMEKFLADYDLVWIGDKDTSPRRKNMYIDDCYEQIVAHIEKLNLVANKDEVRIHRNEKEGKAEFKTTSCVSLKFYKDGMIVSSGPFRSYNESSAVSFIRDILDGYFPSELQNRYPQGVPFEIKNHRQETYLNDDMDFPGQGFRLGKSTKNITKSKRPFESSTIAIADLRSRILASHNNNCSNRHLQSHMNAELSRSRSTEMNNSVTMKNLNLHDISGQSSPISSAGRQNSIELASRRSCSSSVMSRRSKLSKGSLKGSNEYLRYKKSGASLERKNTPPILYQINEPSGIYGELRLKIRSLNGSIVYLVHLSHDEPVSKLYDLLETATSKKLPRGYRIVMSGYPSKKLKRQKESLKDCGITTDSVLHLVNE